MQMSKIRRLIAGSTFGAIALLVAIAGSSSAGAVEHRAIAFNPHADCAEVALWVEQHATELPATFEALSRYPMRYRRAIVSRLTLAERVGVWSDHVRSASDTMALSAHESAYIESLLARLPSLLDPALRDSAELATLRNEAVGRLGLERARLLLTVVGPADQQRSGLRPAAADGSPDGTSDAFVPDCSCSKQSDWCDSGSACQLGGCRVNAGCGTLWSYDCDGLCYQPE